MWIVNIAIIALIWSGICGGLLGLLDDEEDMATRIFGIIFAMFCFALALLFIYLGYFRG